MASQDTIVVASENIHVVTHTLVTREIPEVFDAALPYYLYEPASQQGRWAASTDALYIRWLQNALPQVLKLFSVGELPSCALAATQEQGINQPYWRASVRRLEGWVVCRAWLISISPDAWRVDRKEVVYTRKEGDPPGVPQP